MPRPARIAIRASGRSNRFRRTSEPGPSRAPNGQSLLGSMEVIRNEPSCYNAACHQHAQGDVRPRRCRHRLFARRRSIRSCATARSGSPGFRWAFIVMASLSVGLFVHRLVYLPLRDLESGAQRLSAGNLDQPIPVRSTDEFGKLAVFVQHHDRRAAQVARGTARLGTYARAEGGNADAGAAPRAGGDHARRKAGLGRAAGLGRRPRIEQSADRHPDLLASCCGRKCRTRARMRRTWTW